MFISVRLSAGYEETFLIGDILSRRQPSYIQKHGGILQLLSWRMSILLVFFVEWRIFYLIIGKFGIKHYIKTRTNVE
ncbi:hypothetical protein QFZ28_003115 [Neobacillus niacini]|uniref:hypothetical protein n=1 Tax=Neobacillus niacini TaxID=86668 RepID=UPI0027825DAA|nr:hypothetical protein [Neobacillus niacini]MDQ1002715.1 hypothetical protein [Neobacillus niacini]